MSRDLRLTTAILASAALLRLILYIHYPSCMNDNLDFITLAESVRQIFTGTDTLVDPAPIMWLAPLYPMLLGLLSLLFPGTEILQYILSAFLEIATFFVMFRYMDVFLPRCRRLALFVFAFSPMLAATFHWSLSESLFLFLLSVFLYFRSTGRPLWNQALVVGLLYLTRPEGMFFLLPLAAPPWPRKKEIFIAAGVFILTVAPYLTAMSFYTRNTEISLKGTMFLHLAAILYLDTSDSYDYDEAACICFQKQQWEWQGQTALLKDDCRWVLSERPVIVILKNHLTLLVKSYFYMAGKAARRMMHVMLPLDLPVLLTGLFMLKHDRLFYLFFLAPLIIFPFADIWSAYEATAVRHFAFLGIVFLPHMTEGYRYFAGRLRIKRPQILVILTGLAVFVLHPDYLSALERTTYRANRGLVRQIGNIDFSGKNIMTRSPWVAFRLKGKWHDFAPVDEKFRHYLRDRKIDYIIIEQSYWDFFGQSQALVASPPPMLRQVYRGIHEGIECVVYQVVPDE
ncbi:MAG: hypothetical protein PHQ23_04405 [Candidatus Wallbacteria bacterium]|nr:hypothetical protein [Candidatus Wallbacteria bacterium]